jgi:hypothetical protein
MKVVSNMLDHPKFLKLKKRIGLGAAEHLLRIWGHCETNQKGELWSGADGEYVEIVAKFDGVSGDLFNALVECGWVEKRRGAILIHDWNATNSRAVTNWALGNIPKKSTGKNNGKPTESLGLTNAEPSNSQGLSTGVSPMNEGMNERMNEDGKFNLASQVSPASGRGSKARTSPLVDAAFISDMKKVYQPDDVDRALARMQAWLKTPKGSGKAASKARLVTFLKDSEPLAASESQKNKKEVGPEGWQDAVAELLPDYNCPEQWGCVAPTIRDGIIEAMENRKKSQEVAA